MTTLANRQIARTRRRLHEALISLILRKGYEATTVQDIIDEADVGRSTFYAHYTGKEDLLRKGFEPLRAELAAAQRNGNATAKRSGDQGEILSFSAAMFEHACAHKHIYRALVGSRGGVVVVNEMQRILSDVVQDELPRVRHGETLSRDLAVRFVVGSFMTVMTWLLERKPKVTPADADQMFRLLVIGGIGSAVRNAQPKS